MGSVFAAFFCFMPLLPVRAAYKGRMDVNIVLELFVCTRQGKDAVIFHHCQTDITGSRMDPDAVMRTELVRLGLVNGHSARYAHSTSWRYEGGRTLLTYLVWVNQDALLGLRTSRLLLDEAEAPRSSGPLAPRPDMLRKKDVLMHALMHLRYLIVERKDTWVAETLGDRATCDLLGRLEPSLAGRIATAPVRASD
jgi:hypothetical protein